jgi:hypothetical protein
MPRSHEPHLRARAGNKKPVVLLGESFLVLEALKDDLVVAQTLFGCFGGTSDNGVMGGAAQEEGAKKGDTAWIAQLGQDKT